MVIDGPQLRPLAMLLLYFDNAGLIPTIAQENDKIVVSFKRATFLERHVISRSGMCTRDDWRSVL